MTRPAAATVLWAVLAAVLLAPGARAAAPPGESVGAVTGSGDPLEGLNRKVFGFNDFLDVYFLEPVATGWNWLLPAAVQRSVSNFFSNLRFPVNAVNNLLQGKPRASAAEVGRFTLNSTVGVLGFLDPATELGLPAHDEDFGQTLGKWGVPPGPYLVLPLLGPSNPRDGAGMLIDWPLSVVPFVVGQFVGLGASSVELLNARSLVLEDVRDAKRASLDYYVFVRNAYRQHRRALINDEDSEEATTSDEDDLYSPDLGDEP